MNNNTTHSQLERNISYINDLYKSKMISGHPYDYQNVLQININNFFFIGNENTIEGYKLRDKKRNILTNKITIIFIYLPKIKEKYYNKDRLTELEKLLLVFSEKGSKNLDRIMKGDKIMSEYRKGSLETSENKELHLKMLHNTELQEARQEGMEQGRKEEKIETAKNLLKNGVSLEIVMKSTGLTEEEINRLD